VYLILHNIKVCRGFLLLANKKRYQMAMSDARAYTSLSDEKDIVKSDETKSQSHILFPTVIKWPQKHESGMMLTDHEFYACICDMLIRHTTGKIHKSQFSLVKDWDGRLCLKLQTSRACITLSRPCKTLFMYGDGCIQIADDPINGHTLNPLTRARKHNYPELGFINGERSIPYNKFTLQVAGRIWQLFCLTEMHKTFALASLHAQIKNLQTRAQDLEREYTTKKAQLTS